MKIDTNEKGEPVQASVEMVNKKLESFVEIILSKLTAHQQEISSLKSKIKKLENAAKKD